MVHACQPNFSAVPGVDPTSRQELHYGDTAMAFAALTGCMEVHRYGTHLGNTKALTKAIGVQFVGNRETLKESACFKRHVFFFLDPFFCWVSLFCCPTVLFWQGFQWHSGKVASHLAGGLDRAREERSEEHQAGRFGEACHLRGVGPGGLPQLG